MIPNGKDELAIVESGKLPENDTEDMVSHSHNADGTITTDIIKAERMLICYYGRKNS